MVPILAKEAVIIKSKITTNILLGNYEIGYAIGLIVNISGITFPESYHNMAELLEQVLKELAAYQPRDEREVNLIKMLKGCKPLDNMDEQVQELMIMGLHEKEYWKF